MVVTTRRAAGTAAVLLLLLLSLAGCAEIAKLAVLGEERELRPARTLRPVAARAEEDRAPGVLILAFDGVRQDVLYELLRAGELPGLASLLAVDERGRFPHAHFTEGMLTVFPSVTAAGWAAIFTGEPPAENGVPANEFFIRDEKRLAAPIPGSFDDSQPILATVTDGYANRLLRVPTLYHRLRPTAPGLRSWVSMSPFYAGANRLLISTRTAAVDMVPAMIRDRANGEAIELYEERDQEILDTVIEELDESEDELPHVLTLYVSGTDAHEHASPRPPDVALRRYLKGELDEMMAELRVALDDHGLLDDRYVVLVSDHGHTDVVSDEAHQISAAELGAPLEARGFRVREAALRSEDDSFQAVLGFQGAAASVFLADRSRCGAKGAECDWERPPRFEEDVLAAADAILRASRDPASPLHGTIDLVLARRPKPIGEKDLPFRVYAGAGRLVPVAKAIRGRKDLTSTAFEERLEALAVGAHGERAGDVLVLAKSSGEDDPARRFYFNATPYESGHGSAGPADSVVPFVLAHRGKRAADLGELVASVMGDAPRVWKVADLIAKLRGVPR